MAASLCQIDLDLTRDAVLRFQKRDNLGLVGGGQGSGGSGLQVEFQFPPRIGSDGRGADWDEESIPGGKELVTLSYFREREIALEWTYIIGMNGWSPEKVKYNVSLVRLYFDSTVKKGYDEELAIYFKLWLIGGSEEMTFRAKSVEVSYGKAIVVPGGDVNRAHPLRTDIRLTMKAWSNQGYKETIRTLVAQTLAGWY